MGSATRLYAEYPKFLWLYIFEFLNCIVKKLVNLASASNMQEASFPSMATTMPMPAMQPIPYGFHQQQQVFVLLLITKIKEKSPRLRGVSSFVMA